MIKNLILENFKCYQRVSLPFNNLTVFVGENSVGKSSVIKALLLLKQMACLPGFFKQFPSLSNKVPSDKTASDYFWDLMPADERMSITLASDEDDDPLLLTGCISCDKEPGLPILGVGNKTKEGHSFWKNSFTYLSAERIGPRENFDAPPNLPYEGVGERGEYAAYFLATNEQIDIAVKELALSEEDVSRPNSFKLLRQTELWMHQVGLSKQLQIRATYFDKVNKVSLEYVFFDGENPREYTAQNVGFGLTYTLPIFLSILNAKKGSVVIVENPEAHLHPQAQVEMGVFLSKAADAGVQIIIETHSDHILNGIRLAVKQKKLESSKVQLHYIVRPDLKKGAEVVMPKILPDGRIERWPDGFFDQYETVLSQLI